MKTIFLILALSIPAFADGPKYKQADPKLQDEIENIYRDLKFPNIVNGRASSMTITSLTVSTISAISAVIQVSTINALSMNNHKITGVANGTASSDAVNFGQLTSASKVVQSSCSVLSGTFSTSSQSWATSIQTASITPSSASNYIVIIAQGSREMASTSTSVASFLSLFKGNTNLAAAAQDDVGLNTCYNTISSATNNVGCDGSVLYFDQALTTSATTYAVKLRVSDAGVTTYYPRKSGQLSTICLYEIVSP